MVLVSGRFLPPHPVVSVLVARHHPWQEPKITTESHLAPAQLKLHLQRCSTVLPPRAQPQLLEGLPVIPREGTVCASSRNIRACHADREGWEAGHGAALQIKGLKLVR